MIFFCFLAYLLEDFSKENKDYTNIPKNNKSHVIFLSISYRYNLGGIAELWWGVGLLARVSSVQKTLSVKMVTNTVDKHRSGASNRLRT